MSLEEATHAIQATLPKPARGQRWFLNHGARTYFRSGFATKKNVSAWIDHFGESLEWRVGFTFKIKGINEPYAIVSKRGLSPDVQSTNAHGEKTRNCVGAAQQEKE